MGIILYMVLLARHGSLYFQNILAGEVEFRIILDMFLLTTHGSLPF